MNCYSFKKFQDIKVYFTVHNDEPIIGKVLKAGDDSPITKNNTGEVLSEGIDGVVAGSEYFSLEVVKVLQERFLHKELKNLPILSVLEKKILCLVLAGRTYYEISSQLGIPYKTVEFHQGNLYIKFNAKNIVDLAKEANRMGVLNIKSI